MKRRLTRLLEYKKNLEVELCFKKIYTHELPEKLDFVDLTVVWQRGTEQQNETKGYEMNYLECDQEMDEVFRRVSGFYSKDRHFQTVEPKMCTFYLKEYKWKDGLRSDRGIILGQLDYDMSKHVDKCCFEGPSTSSLNESELFKDISRTESKASACKISEKKRIKFPKVKNYGNILIEFTMHVQITEHSENKKNIRDFNKRNTVLR